jgi:hypothetical protein
MPFIRRIFRPLAPEDTKPKFVAGEPVAGSKHYLITEQEQRERGWLQTDAWKRLSGR